MLIRALVCVESSTLRQRIRRSLADLDVVVNPVRAGADLWKRLGDQNADLVLISRSLISEPAATTTAQFRELPDRPDVIVFGAEENAEQRAELIAAGCFAVLDAALPESTLHDTLQALVGRRSEWQSDRRELTERPERYSRLKDFVSSSPNMQSFLKVAERVVPSDSSVLIEGETGVGKERLARAIHNEGPRSSQPFIAVNCGALSESLLESELFGHEQAAFTGATRARRGYFELAHRGTIFLDEVGELAPHLQVKLLRVLQERELVRVGGEAAVDVNVRVMAATHRDLLQETGSGSFRRDLYYRLAVVTLTIPPLRDRAQDIPDMAQSYVEHFAAKLVRNVHSISPQAMQSLVAYAWPGNVRELINVIERAVLLTTASEITCDDLPETVIRGRAADGVLQRSDTQASVFPNEWLDKPWAEARKQCLEQLEHAYFERLLQSTDGRVGETASLAGIEPRSLFTKMKRHGLRKENYKKTRRTSRRSRSA